MHDIQRVYKKARVLFAKEGLAVELGNMTVEYRELGASYFGYCEHILNHHKIVINTILGDDRNPVEVLEDTIIHEMIHTIDGCRNHGKKFQRIARMFDKYGYDIHTTASESNLVVPLSSAIKKGYVIKCHGCGCEWTYQRRSKTVKMVESNHARCGCGSRDLEVVKFG